MRYFNEQTEDKLGYSQLRDLLAGRATTEEGKAQCVRLKPYSKPRGIEVELGRVMECRNLLRAEEPFYFEVSQSVAGLLDHASVPGNWLRVDDIFRLQKWLRMVRELITYFKARKETYPLLWRMVERLNWNKNLPAHLDRILDSRGNMRDDASPKLKLLRRERNAQSADLRKSLASILRNAIQNGWSEASEITIRNDRFVIPMISDFKGRIKGFVHDVSQSGRTIFVEPTSVLEQNNRIREIFLEEHNEVTRILLEVTAMIREEVPSLRDYSKSVARLDFVRAKARLAIDTGSEKPKFDPKRREMNIILGRHPLLLLKSGMQKEDVVPLSLHMDADNRIILISGPNAGGKSVSLKTVGLLQLMLQSGLLVPCSAESEFTWFNQLFIDIGDEQSIQSDLSTYTSHLQNMGQMLKHLHNQSLFLMDEFGSGTDPKLGGALAEAFLEKFVEAGAFGVITTHYGNLKNYADHTPGLVNAAMQFDPTTLTPTYSIEVGVPGRSYAFEIAKNVGIPKAILKSARERIDGEQIYSEELLLKLESQKAELEQVLGEQKTKNAELKKWLERNQQLNKQIKSQQTGILAEAHKQAEGLINQANAKIEHTIKEIREQQADRERTRELRKELREMLPEPPPAEPDEVVEREVPKEVKPDLPVVMPGATISEGDWVQMVNTVNVGKVLNIQGKRAVVSMGELRVTVKLNQLERIKSPKHVREVAGGGRGSVGKMATVSTELRVKGFRVEQALPVVNKFIDDAIVAGLKEVRILHGKGTGALRQAIRDTLHKVPEVSRFTDAELNAGGAGWTVVSLK